MKNICIFDTSQGTLNMGDYIIKDSCMRELKDIINNNFVVEFATHTPIAHDYQVIFNKTNAVAYCKKADLKILLGTNIVTNNLFALSLNWNVNYVTSKLYQGTVLMGVGMASSKKNMNWYTKKVYKRMLSKKYIHSTRDEKTKQFLEEMGFKAINTGCPTMWQLTEKHCKKIPQKKADSVLFTLTDYAKDYKNDKRMIEILKQNYEEIYFWIQGSGDLDYLKSLVDIKNINIINPNIEDLKNILVSKNIDYVGTRLHAGIYAMQHFCRAIIVIVDNRARDMKENYNLNVIERTNIDKLAQMINSNFKTNILINEKNIKIWKNQFSNKNI